MDEQMYSSDPEKLLDWTSLVVQWLRICLPKQGMWVGFMVWESPTCHGATKPDAPQVLSQCSRAHELQLQSL